MIGFARKNERQQLGQEYYNRLIARAADAARIPVAAITSADGRRNSDGEALYVRDAVIAFLMQTYCPASIAQAAGITYCAVRASAVRHRRVHKAARR